MKIGIEAQRIFRKKKHGMDMVALELIRNLQQLDNINQYVVFVRPDEDNTVLQETANFQIVELAGGPYPFWEQILLPAAARKHGCELLHCTGNTAPLFSSIPLMVTLHDIIYMESSLAGIFRDQGSAYQKFGNAYRRMIVPAIVKKSKRIVTVSEFEKNCISSYFNLHNDKRLITAYNGVSNYFKPVTDPGVLSAVKETYKLPDHFFFFLGNTHPKKNTRRTLIAFANFIRQTDNPVYLVMIDYDKHALEKMLNVIEAPDLINRIVLTGYVNNQDLPAIYSLSELFLYPSLRESFGIPVVEAMACGTPVITSNTSSMPEIAGNAALLIDPYQPAAITAAMNQLFSDGGLRNRLKEDGLLQAQKFSWRVMAQQVLGMYRDILKKQAPDLKYIL